MRPRQFLLLATVALAVASSAHAQDPGSGSQGQKEAEDDLETIDSITVTTR